MCGILIFPRKFYYPNAIAANTRYRLAHINFLISHPWGLMKRFPPTIGTLSPYRFNLHVFQVGQSVLFIKRCLLSNGTPTFVTMMLNGRSVLSMHMHCVYIRDCNYAIYTLSCL